MKALVAKEQFLTDAEGRRTDVVLDLATYEHLREAEEELANIKTYDVLRDRTHLKLPPDSTRRRRVTGRPAAARQNEIRGHLPKSVQKELNRLLDDIARPILTRLR